MDPLSFVIRHVSTKLYFHRGLFQSALQENQRCRQLNGNKDHLWIAAHDFRINLELGNDPAALDGFKRCYSNFQGLITTGEIDSSYRRKGFTGVLNTMIDRTDDYFEKARWYGILGDHAQALVWLEKSVNAGTHGWRP